MWFGCYPAAYQTRGFRGTEGDGKFSPRDDGGGLQFALEHGFEKENLLTE